MKKGNGINKKVLLGTLSMLLCVFIVIITSFLPFIIDPSRFMTVEFLTNELIIVAIVIFSMVCMIFIGQAQNSSNPDSEIAKAKRKFNETIKLIDNKQRFCQWIRQVQQPNDLKNIRIREMQKVGIERYDLVDLSINEIKGLVEGNKEYRGKFYAQITKVQARTIIDLKNNNNITFVQPTYYLTHKTIDSDKTVTEKSANESKKKTSILTMSIISKVVMTVLTAMIITSLIPDPNTDKNIIACAGEFVSRMMAMVSSSYMGFTVGYQINDIDADYIEMRCMVHEQYSEDKTFVALSENDYIKKEIENERGEQGKENTNTETTILD